MTQQPKGENLQAWFEKLFTIFKEDQEKDRKEQEYANLLDPVVLFAAEDDFSETLKTPDSTNEDEDLEKLTPYARYLEMLKKYSGIDTERLMFYLKDVDTSVLSSAIGATEEAIK